MDVATAQDFAASWVKAWNAHDLEQLLGHFADDVVFASPVAAQLFDGSDGVLRGKAALRDYWAQGLRLIPDLHFTVLDVYVGVSAVVINYRNQKGARVSEVLIFDGPLVVQGHGTYLGGDPNPAGATAG
jgi:ketosteroid isomerase-like protein